MITIRSSNTKREKQIMSGRVRTSVSAALRRLDHATEGEVLLAREGEVRERVGVENLERVRMVTERNTRGKENLGSLGCGLLLNQAEALRRVEGQVDEHVVSYTQNKELREIGNQTETEDSNEAGYAPGPLTSKLRKSTLALK